MHKGGIRSALQCFLGILGLLKRLYIYLSRTAPYTAKTHKNLFRRLPEGQVSTLPHREKTPLVSSPALKKPVVVCRHQST